MYEGRVKRQARRVVAASLVLLEAPLHAGSHFEPTWLVFGGRPPLPEAVSGSLLPRGGVAIPKYRGAIASLA